MQSNPTVIRMITQALFIFCVSSITGISFNYLRGNSIPIISVAKHKDISDLSISINKAKIFFSFKKAIFLDARAYNFYKKVHIKGAINIPADQDEKKLKSINIPKDKIIIVYCDNDMCDLSKELAMKLYSLGYEKVYYLKNGLDAWISNNLPVEKAK